MKKKRGKKINIKLSNRWLYTFIILGILAIVGVGVWAAAPNPGHTANQIDFSNIGSKVIPSSAVNFVGGTIKTTTGYGVGQSFYDMGAVHFAAGDSIYSYGKICSQNSQGSCDGSGGTVIDGGTISASRGRIPAGTFQKTNFRENDLFDALAPSIPSRGNTIIVSGAIYSGGRLYPVSYAYRASSSQIRLYSVSGSGSTVLYYDNGETAVITTAASLAW
jgi:hypothetical protein